MVITKRYGIKSLFLSLLIFNERKIMDRKVKIRVMDSTSNRRNDFCKAIQPYNSLENACRGGFYENGNMISETDIDLFLLHINDQVNNQDNPDSRYLQDVNKRLPNAPIILYSGAGISVEEHTRNKIKIKQGKTLWEFDVYNGDGFCIVKRNINKASDLNITEALKKYIATSSKDDFFKLVLDIARPHLIALSILCQGYLAANEECLEDEKKIIKLPEGISISEYKKGNTRTRDWWMPALGANFEGNELNKELETVDKDKDVIKRLMKIIENKKDEKGNIYFENDKLLDKKVNSKIEKFTDIVNAAYGQLKDIPKTMK